MPSATAFQTNFSAGELSPRLYARVDVGKYMNGCALVQNMVAQRFGGLKKRGGTEYINTTDGGNKFTRLIPFIFSVTQAYILEFTDQKIRIYTNGGIVVGGGGSPIEVSTPYTGNELFGIQYAQSADVLYLTHPNHEPRTLSRLSSTSFSLDVVEFEDGPFLEINTTSTTLDPSGFGVLTPAMTSNTTPSGTVTSTDSLATAWHVFDKNGSSTAEWTGTTGFVAYELATGSGIVDHYYLTAPDTSNAIKMPITWKIEGSNNGSTWVTLDSRQGESGWTGGETRFYTFSNKTAYSHHRLRWLGNDDTGGTPNTMIAEIGFNRTNHSPFDLTASSTAGINNGQGFLASDVGRMIRLQGSDGQWRWARIESRTSSTVVSVSLNGFPLPDLRPFLNWRLGAWSDQTGWPGSVGFYTGRLCFARTSEQPQTVWMSVVDDFTNFSVSQPLQDDDAITATIASDSLNEIKWIAEGTDLFVGTTAAIRTIGPTTSTAAFSPTNIQQKRETNYGASEVQPVRVGTTALYSGYYRKDIREISYSFDFNGYVSQNLSILSEHITGLGVTQLAYAQDPDSVVWGSDDLGALFGMTYERDQEVIAFHTHEIGGTEVEVESVATIPGVQNDEIWIVVKRLIDGGTARYLERIIEGIRDTQSKEQSRFLDSFLTYSGASTTTITGLEHLEGESVHVWGGSGSGAFKQGPYTVSSGTITIDVPVADAIVGLAYTSAIETLSPEAAARGGTAQTRLGRISEVFLRLDRSVGGKCGPSDGTLEALDYTKSIDVNGNYGDGIELFTGDVRVPIPMDWNRGKRIRVEHSDPTPFHVLGFITEIRVSG